MKKYEITKFAIPEENVEIDVLVHENKVWLTRKDIALLFGVNSRTITRYIDDVLNKNEDRLPYDKCYDNPMTKLAPVEFLIDKKIPPNTRLFNLDFIMKLNNKLNNNRGVLLKQFVDSIFNAGNEKTMKVQKLLS